jgi:hypothetical protein
VGFRRRRQLFRAYHDAGHQVHNRIAEPDEVDSVLAELLDRPEVAFIHSRDVLAGCYMFAVSPLPAQEEALDQGPTVPRNRLPGNRSAHFQICGRGWTVTPAATATSRYAVANPSTEAWAFNPLGLGTTHNGEPPNLSG